jgi:hypothetical protein
VAPGGRQLDAARVLLAEADAAQTAAERYRCAHVAALRTTAALFAGLGPGRVSRRRPVNAWVLLAKVAPDLSGWAEVFAASAPKRAAAEAGIDSAIGPAEAAEQVQLARRFLDAVEERLGLVEVELAG